MGVILIIGVIVTLSVVLTNNNNNSIPPPSSTKNDDDKTNDKEVNNNGSSIGTGIPSWKIRQRYLLALLYISQLRLMRILLVLNGDQHQIILQNN